VTEAFADKLRRIQSERKSDLALLLAPRLPRLPLPIQRYDDPFLPFGKAVIQTTRDLVCAYVFDFPAYLAIGAAGAIALERTIAYAGRDVITILHGAFTGSDYVALMDETSFNVDAITISEGKFPIVRNDRTVFIVRSGETKHTESPAYWKDSDLFCMDDLQLRLVGEEVLYRSSGEDFADHINTELARHRIG
jgi:hypothetical protein